MKEDGGEELGSNAEQVVGRGLLDGSTHCGSNAMQCIVEATLPAWTLPSTHCGPLPGPPASHCASQPLISQSIYLLPQSLLQTYLPTYLSEEPLWSLVAFFSFQHPLILYPYQSTNLVLFQRPSCTHHRKCHHRHCHDHVHDQVK